MGHNCAIMELPREIVGKIFYFAKKEESAEKIQRAWKLSEMKRNIIYERILQETSYFHWDDHEEKIINIFKMAKKIKCKTISKDPGFAAQLVGLYNYISGNEYNYDYVFQIRELTEDIFKDYIALPDF
jgi:hypothetical protein